VTRDRGLFHLLVTFSGDPPRPDVATGKSGLEGSVGLPPRTDMRLAALVTQWKQDSWPPFVNLRYGQQAISRLEAAGAIGDLDAAAVYHLTEWRREISSWPIKGVRQCNTPNWGRTGLDCLPALLGCMSYGGGNSGFHQWSLGEAESRPSSRRRLKPASNFLRYRQIALGRQSRGGSRPRAQRFRGREEVVIATKVFNRMRPGPNGAGLSRKKTSCRDR